MTQASSPAPRAIAGLKPLRIRLAGPGGLYNIGNALGLAGGLGFAIAAAAPDWRNGMFAALTHLAGNGAALLITLAMLVFFWGGEVYHRAWAHGAPPDPALNRQGDLLSGAGALLLGAGLLLTGQPVLALSAGLLHALGKFGSAAPRLGLGLLAPDTFRRIVVASRLPAILLVLIDIAAAMAEGTPWAPQALLLACYLIWTRADILLLRPA